MSSTSFNYFERTVARILSKFPAIKSFTKYIYSRLVYLKSKKKYQFKTSYSLSAVSCNKQQSFFGYYDKSPISDSGFILSHVVHQDTRKNPNADETIFVSLVDPEIKEPILQVETHSFNWQQGARAHWLTDDLFIFNDFDLHDQQYIARVYSKMSLCEVKRFNLPVQDSYGTDYYLSLNYQRLMALRPDYGYRNLPSLSIAELMNHKSDGIRRVDYSSGEQSLIVSLEQVCAIEAKTVFDQALHKLNHVMISPSGDRFIFIHRYFVGMQRFDRLFLADAQTGELTLLAAFGMVSHCFWLDENTILGYLRGPGDKDAYWLIDISTGRFKHFSVLDRYSDGHPHVCGDWFITDTYPDRARMQHLLLCNWKTDEVRELGEFYHGFEYSGESRCDLHPRLSPDGQSAFFDSVFDGSRRLYRLDLK